MSCSHCVLAMRGRRCQRVIRSDCSSVSLSEDPSPDLHALFGRQIQLVAWLYTEGFIPRGDVSHDAVHPIHRGAMRIGHDLVAQSFVALEAAPHLRPGEK